MAIWKVSHGKGSFNDEQYQWLLDNDCLAVHESTGKNQGVRFRDVLKGGDIVSLSRSNRLNGLYRVVGDELVDNTDTDFSDGWLLRRCEPIKVLEQEAIYKGQKKGWTPNFNSTFSKVQHWDLALFEKLILKPFFKMELSGLDSEYTSIMNSDEEEQIQSILGLNTIFYGPPGTGKTYHSVMAAVKAAEPDFKGSWSDAKVRYDQLINSGRIGFVTFHQSYGYEDFVEGLRANSEDGQISYDNEKGIFRQMCERAQMGVDVDADPLERAIEAFKVDIEDGEPLELKTEKGKAFHVGYRGKTTFRVFPNESIKTNMKSGYGASIDNIRKLYRDDKVKGIYNPSYVKSILCHLKTKYSVPDCPHDVENNTKQNYVLIIDEINRGNISKIFGELITIIEPSKRLGKDESLTVTLPLSKDDFGVPSNLYIIGTMNTADRSLAMMDTALRRRFDFVEMMPKLSLLEGVEVKGINLQRLLKVINLRIETLYDREHTLGHAFFMPVVAAKDDEDKAMTLLASAFQNKIMPLLEEYFFEDWHKIQLVLADHQKGDDLYFIEQLPNKIDDLFGAGHGLNHIDKEQKRYILRGTNHEVWSIPEAYIQIYSNVEESLS